ncbi:TonB-dependent receptor plug domain-containing protein [Aquirufa aurantiipilula]|uniref:TonB-dependent receptor n=1 Tax=Aquirufa aurantiipilula TaxID=2696561 RepID=A0ABT6BK73_9BACT|nr:TonB-dependent receptor [Aquirufa aurantiipilula]MDF5690863.1 TonB-dependent receptor [Aquirufa aurantiipilula]
MKIRIGVFILLILVSQRVSLFAQKAASDTLQNIVVSASRKAQTALQIPYSTQVWTDSSIRQKGARTSPELLMNMPGIFLQKTNQGGGSLFVRGLTGNQTLLMLDGIRFNNSTFRYGPNQYLNTIDPFTLERVESVMGSGAVQYGSDALTGVVHLYSQKPQFSSKPLLQVGLQKRWASSDMENAYQGKIMYGQKNWSLLVSGSSKKFGDLIRGNQLGAQSPSGYQEGSSMFKFRHQASKTFEWEVGYQQMLQNNVPVYHKIVLENFAINEMEKQKYERIYWKGTARTQHAWAQKITGIVAFQSSVENRRAQKNGSPTLRVESDQVNTRSFSLDVESQWTKHWSSTSGFEIYHDWVGSSRADINQSTQKTTALRGLYPDQSTYEQSSLFTLHHIRMNQYQLELGMRWHQVKATLPDTTLGLSIVQNQALVYTAGISRFIGPNSSLYLSSSSGFRSPNLDDLGSLGIVDFRYEKPAYQLKPEYSLNLEVGYKLENYRFRQQLSVFRTGLSNLITRVKTSNLIQGYPVYEKRNVEESYLAGGEWSGLYKINTKSALQGQISYVFGQNLTQNEPMRRIPPLHGSIQYLIQTGRFTSQVEHVFALSQERLSAGDKSDNRMNPLGTAGWGILNLQTTYARKHWQLSLQLQNLGDVDYRMHGSGINGVGRSVWAQFLVLM